MVSIPSASRSIPCHRCCARCPPGRATTTPSARSSPPVASLAAARQSAHTDAARRQTREQIISEETPMAQSELYKKGEAIRRQLRGEADYERNKREYDADPAMKKFIDVATETVFGALWARPGLD